MPWRSPARGANSAVGIYDRDYYRQEERPGMSLHIPQTIVGKLIAVNVALWIADYLVTLAMPNQEHWLSDHMAVHVDTLTQPWLWWQYLTAGFAHSPLAFQHIMSNMLVLFFLGRDVEEAYGPREFLRLYLTMVVFASVVWNVANNPFIGSPAGAHAYGASGAIAGVVILYALNFPRRTLLLFFVIPMPAWVLGVMVVVLDMFGALNGSEPIAYSMHLAGAAFAFIYYKLGWNLTRLTEAWPIAWPKFRRKPRLRVHKPEEPATPDLSEEVDRILEKIYREGESSLTASERKTLETASREYQRRKR